MKRVLRVILINVLILLGALIGLEMAARFFVSATSENISFFRESLFVSPWFTTTDRPAPDLLVRNGELFGLFKHEDEAIPLKKNANEIRIVALGGSTTKNQTAWLSGQIDYSAALESILRERLGRPDIRVLNAGSEAYSTAHTLVNLALRVSAFSPDIIVVMHNANDRSAGYFGSHVLPDYANKYMSPIYLAPEVQRFQGIYGILVQSRVLSRLGIVRLFAEGKLVREDALQGVEDVIARNIRSINALAQSLGIQALFLTQPHRLRANDEASNGDHEHFNDILLSEVSAINGQSLDMAKIFGSDPEYFEDEVHYTTQGVNRFAELLAPRIIGMIQALETETRGGPLGD